MSKWILLVFVVFIVASAGISLNVHSQPATTLRSFRASQAPERGKSVLIVPHQITFSAN